MNYPIKPKIRRAQCAASPLRNYGEMHRLTNSIWPLIQKTKMKIVQE